jgi:hydroxymethylpyrimidine/phosphomethylpyrimidine kinase
MLSQPAIIETVAAGLQRHGAKQVVLDPVMVAASGDRLLAPEAIDTLKHVLIPRAFLVTPNMPEAAAILDEPMASDEETALSQAKRIFALGAQAVLLKGGHGTGPESVDLLVDASGVQRLASKRIDTVNTHGTGCTLSSAIAAGLAKGLPLKDAVFAAKDYVSAAIAASDQLAIGRGHGPVHHFHAIWS